MKRTLRYILSLTVSVFLCACHSSVQKTAFEAFIEKDVKVTLSALAINDEGHYKELLSFCHNGKKDSLLVIADFKKNDLKLTGLTPSAIELFNLHIDNGGALFEAKIPLKALPPFEQVLLDIVLSQYSENGVTKILPDGYTMVQQDKHREIYNSKNECIYHIEFKKVKEKFLPVTIENRSFNYTIKIRYL